MSRLRFGISVSLDGYVAGPEQTIEQPLGIGGEALHEWVFPLAAWRKPHGLAGGEVNDSTPVMERSLANVGATIMGRNMFGGGPGPWNTEQPWIGWWKDHPPFHHPVFVLTHHRRDPLPLKGGTTFHFVTGGIEDALDRAREAANGKDVWLSGGAETANEYLRAGLVDEMQLHLVPLLLGGGARLFEGVGTDMAGLRPVRTTATAKVTHLEFARR
ncbi:MAG TPA: dihydrofolate reductase family protein [Gemmatimonadales bacterium]|nr:dihydrofolate reductase family protein [Gemmatimonadales bacterium]